MYQGRRLSPSALVIAHKKGIPMSEEKYTTVVQLPLTSATAESPWMLGYAAGLEGEPVTSGLATFTGELLTQWTQGWIESQVMLEDVEPVEDIPPLPEGYHSTIE